MEHVERRKPKKRTKPSAIAVERRGELQEAAIRCIAAKGYAAVTVAMICDEAGFSRGLIGHYFKGKDELVLEAISRCTTQLRDATRQVVEAAGADPIERLHGVVRASFSPPGFTENQTAVWTALTSNSRWSRPLGEMYGQLWRQYQGGIQGLIERAAAQLNRNIDAKAAALVFCRMIEGFWIGWVADPKMMSAEEAESACHALVDLLLGNSPYMAKTAL